MNFEGIPFRMEGGLWVGVVSTKFGVVDVLLDGSEAGPSEDHLQAYRRFAEDLDTNLVRLRTQIRFAFLWRPVRIAVNSENRVGVQFKNRVTGRQTTNLCFDNAPRRNLRAVPGAAVMSHDGKVVYNLLTPHMQQFMGRCVGATKRAGIKAKGTGQFSILIGETEAELRLEEFYEPSDNPGAIDSVVERARQLAAK